MSTRGNPIEGYYSMTELARIKQLWLDSRRCENTKKNYARMMASFEQEYDLLSARRGDLVAYQIQLQQRGLSNTTINTHLAALSSFYRFAMRQDFFQMNPADIDRLPVTPYGKSTYLDRETCRQVIEQIDRATLKGKRDYPLLFGYMLTGLRNSAWRVARWSDFQEIQGHRFYTWSLKGKIDEKTFIAPPLWKALMILKVNTETEHVFTALNGEDKPLRTDQANTIFKRYAKAINLNPAGIHIHMLRHSNAMMRDFAGQDVKKMSKGLSHSNVQVTQIYYDHMKLFVDDSWVKVSEFLGVEQ